MLEGLELINRIQLFWKMYEDSTSSNTIYMAGDFLDLIVKLYSKIFEYHARVVGHLSNSQIRRAWDAIGGGIGWKSEARKIEKIYQSCRECLDQAHREEVQRCVDAQLREIQQSRDILQNISDILDETRRQYDDNTEREILEQLFADHEIYKNSLNPPQGRRYL